MGSPDLFPRSHCQYPVERWSGGEAVPVLDFVAEEVPVALVYNGVSHVVMMATPWNLEDFALGFSLSEGILEHKDELYDLEVVDQADGIEVRMAISLKRFARLKEQRRNLTGRTGCGVCGAESLRQAVRRPPPVTGGPRVTAQGLHCGLENLGIRQPLNRLTGAVHGAAWALPCGTLQLVREDVGRHNALDKLIGALARREADFGSGFALVTSRASYEIVQKAATVGMTLLAAISAPTGLAIRLAQATGLTLVGFARCHRHVVYTHPHRVA